MPELPEVETMRRGVLEAAGGTIAAIERPRCKLKPIEISPRLPTFRRRTVGRTVAAVDRLGKRLLLRLDDRNTIVIEPRMTGLVLIAEPPDVEHLRLRLEIRGADISQIWFWDRRGLGSVRLLTPHGFQQQLGPHKLGPDALTVTHEAVRDRLRASKRAVKVALLDQRALAGIGNLYASEILHVAAIHPAARCNRLTRNQWRRLHDAMCEVLEAAVRHEGSTLSDGTYRSALNNAGNYQNHHRVYNRAGESCPTCGEGIIRRIVQAQRSSFFCPVCQTRA